MDWTEFTNVFGTVGPTVVALAVVILNRRDRLADKVNALAERLAAVETRLDGIDRRLDGIERGLGRVRPTRTKDCSAHYRAAPPGTGGGGMSRSGQPGTKVKRSVNPNV